MDGQAPEVFHIGCGLNASAPPSVESIGFKAFNLARLARLELAVPPAFVLGTGHCRRYLAGDGVLAEDTKAQIRASLRHLEAASGLSLGSARRPLLVSVRSGAPVSMPGMLDTVLNVGLCDATLPGLLRLTGSPRMAWDSYRRLAQSFGEVVLGVDPGRFMAAVREVLSESGAERPQQLDFRGLRSLTGRLMEICAGHSGRPFPQNPAEQLDAAVAAVFGSWNSPRAQAYRRANDIPDSSGTSATVQQMVFGNAGGNSGAGVAFTRDPATGEDRLYLDFAFNVQGEDIVSGRTALEPSTDLARRLPGVYAELLASRLRLEREFRTAQEFEFTVQDGRLYLLQTRTAKRTPWAALRTAVEQVREGIATPAQALARLDGIDLSSIVRRRVADESQSALASAVPASIGLAVGAIALDTRACERLNARGQAAILVRSDTSTEDIAGIAVAVGVLTARGGRTSHAAVVARQMGKVCLVGCEALRIDERSRTISFGQGTLREGETLCLDAERGRVLGREPEVVVERPEGLLSEVARWRAEAGSAPA